MAAVIAAILAAFLAGSVALFREHRLQQRRLFVAARVLEASFGVASQSIKSSVKGNHWAAFNSLPSIESFAEAWDASKADLAGHLAWEEWGQVEKAVNIYLAGRTMQQEGLPEASEEVLLGIRMILENGRTTLRPYCERRLSVWQLAARSNLVSRLKGGSKPVDSRVESNPEPEST